MLCVIVKLSVSHRRLMKTVVKPISVSVVLTEYDNFIIFADGYQYYLSVVNSQFV